MSNTYSSFIEYLIDQRRRQQPNGSGFILGLPGQEQTTPVEDQIRSILQSSPDDVILFDTEGNYLSLTEELNAQVIRPAVGLPIHINPFDINTRDASPDYDALLFHKGDFLISLCEILIGGSYGLSPYQQSLIRACVNASYATYFDYSRYEPSKREDTIFLPTMRDFYRHMRVQAGFDAKILADGLQPIVLHTDTLNTTSNIQHTKRFVVYDLQHYRGEMLAVIILLILEHVWTKYISTQKASDDKPFSWVYLDDISSLLRHESVVQFISCLSQKSSAYRCILTGCTKSAEPFFRYESSKHLLANCEYFQTQRLPRIDQEKVLSLLQVPASLDAIVKKAVCDDESFIRFGNRYITKPQTERSAFHAK